MEKFQSIGQFKDMVRRVNDLTRYVGKDENGGPIYDTSKPLPTLTLLGTPKIHGTNAGVRFEAANPDTLAFQSRERDLSITSDNAGFCMWASQPEVTKALSDIIERVRRDYDDADKIVLFGEWCGGNIQSGVAVNGLPKMFCLFEIHVIFGDSGGVTTRLNIPSHLYVSDIPALNIYDVHTFKTYEVVVDFEEPHKSVQTFVDLTQSVEDECPVGKHFGKSGVGEGIVWHTMYNGHMIHCKTKGAKHSNSKTKTIAPVDVEKFDKASAFVDSETADARMNQGIAFLKEMQIPIEKASVGPYIRWVTNDIFKECQDEIVANQLDAKAVASEVAKVAKKFFFNYLDQV